ncbi:MAG: hypothetical protein ACFFD4_35865 [Candidatus Odinarchaeota archaeon]
MVRSGLLIAAYHGSNDLNEKLLRLVYSEKERLEEELENTHNY